jgi:anti-sigma B factor antagonist
MELTFEIDGSGDEQTTLIVSGEIDALSAPRLRERIEDLLSQGARLLIVDLDGVDFMDSSGLGVLVSVNKKVAAQDRELKLVCHRRQLLTVFEITGLDQVFTFVDPEPREIGNIPGS